VSRCAGHKEELAEVAVGKPASDALNIHFQECRACAAELERQRALVRRMDVAVRAIVCSPAPPELFASIAARVRSTEQSWRWRGAWQGAAVGAVFALCIGLIFGLRAMQLPATSGSNAAALTAWHSPTSALLESRDSILEAPLHDVWFDLEPRTFHSRPTPGDTHDA